VLRNLNHKFYIKSTKSVRLVNAHIIYFSIYIYYKSVLYIYYYFFKIELELIIYNIIQINGKKSWTEKWTNGQPKSKLLENAKKNLELKKLAVHLSNFLSKTLNLKSNTYNRISYY